LTSLVLIVIVPLLVSAVEHEVEQDLFELPVVDLDGHVGLATRVDVHTITDEPAQHRDQRLAG